MREKLRKRWNKAIELIPKKTELYRKQIVRLTSHFVGWIQLKKEEIQWKSPKVIASGVILAVCLTLGIAYLNSTTSVTIVSVNGTRVGLAAKTAQAKELVNNVLHNKGQAVGLVASTHDKITYHTIRVKNSEPLEAFLTEQDMENILSVYINGSGIIVNGEQVAVLPSLDEANNLLKSYQELYAAPSENNTIESVSYLENVEVKAVEAQPEDVKTAEAVLKDFQSGKTSTVAYTVQANDSWWLIARKNNMKTKEVLAGNPGTTEDTKLKIGATINLVTTSPYITVVAKGVYSGNETIPFDVVTKSDNSLASGQTVVKQEGSDGSKIVTYSYVQQNGKNVTKQILNEQITTAATTQIIAKGPNRAPVVVAMSSSRGSGSVSGLAWPLRGNITSYYGYRRGSFHTGLDIDGDTGDPYTAAASGKVVAAGWDGGYGNMILIDHGNGVMTRYGHSSKLLVSVGQYVNQGQTIGLVGSTGNSTGSHLHFEVIINGDTTNPLRCLP